MLYDNIALVFRGGKMKKIFKSKKKLLISIVAVAIMVLLVVNVCASAFFSLVLYKRGGWSRFEKYSYGAELKAESEWLEGIAKKVQIENSENKEITALEIKNEHVSHSYIIICHQYGGSPASMEEYARHFYDLGFNIIMPYMRGHGDSPYNNITFGWKDSDDVTAWVNSIVREDEDARIALFGVSLGANAVAVCASEELPENVRLVIADSCYTSMEALLKEYVKNETPFSSLLVTGLTAAFAKNKLGGNAEFTDTIIKIRDIELPIMFINGENDEVVPPLVSKRLYENCDAEGVEEVIIEEGLHGRNLQADKETYWSYTDAFILNNIGI